MLNIDYSLWPVGTLWIQIFSFCILILLMNVLVYRPIRRVMMERKDATNSLVEKIEGYMNWCQQSEKAVEEGIGQARKEGHKEKLVYKDIGVEEENKILQEAIFFVEKKVGDAREEINIKIEEAGKALGDQIAGFSRELAEKILGRSIQ
ncbi:MAG: ATP synthase F0 subunit B [Deltaproteobacteria bacterium]|nr:ATP synthase F0 subunit B [Deltaproteobacteria bacterium]